MADKPERRVALTYLDQVKTRRQDFLDDRGILPVGTLTLFAGRGGEGKTTYALDYVAKVSTGTLDGDLKGKPRNVLIVSHEDDAETQLGPRLIAAGAARGNVIFFRVSTTYGGVDVVDVPSLVGDQDLFQRAIDETNPALIVVDPLSSSIDGDPNKTQDVRRSLQPLAAILHKNNLTCIGIHHLNKSSGGYVGNLLTGSHAFRDVARSVLMFATDKTSGDRVLSVDKSSYGNVAGKSYGFRLVSVSVPVDSGGETSVARVEHLGESSVSVEDLMAREREPGDSGRGDSTSWLREYLEAADGTARQTDIVGAGKFAGYAETTLQLASRKLGLRRSGGGKGGPVWWHLDAIPAIPAIPEDYLEGSAPIAPIAPIDGIEGPL
jgi:RecA/RadA recombinase